MPHDNYYHSQLPTTHEDRRALLERFRAQRDTLVENIAEATKFLADTEKQIADLEGYVIRCERI